MPKYVVGITGASGSIYAVRLIEELLKKGHNVELVLTENGSKVFEYELNYNIVEFMSTCHNWRGNINLHEIDNLFAPIASGSYQVKDVILLPCSMATLAKIATGVTDNLITRAADVALKEKRGLIILPRETPLNSIHLENMLKLTKIGVTILPPMPAFYHKPNTVEELIDATVGRVLDNLKISHDLCRSWNGGV